MSHDARELEHIMGVLHAPHHGKEKKPHTYRRRVRKDYLSIAKQRKPRAKKIRKAVRKQLGYVARNLKTIARLKEQSSLSLLTRQEYKQLLVISELYRQQHEMHHKRARRIDDRIVSISQPHVRPIVRGKASSGTEFGAKVSISLVEGYALTEKLAWDNYNEGTTLQASAERYKKRFGYYPEAILADQIYCNRKNRAYCKAKGIRLSGPALGRPAKEKAHIQRQLAKRDAAERNAIEGKFGEGKRHYGMGLISTRLRQTSETVIAMQLMIMNLERMLRLLFYHFFKRYSGSLAKVIWAV